MDDERQKNQRELASVAKQEGEALMRADGGTESTMAKGKTESPASTERLMEEVCERDNLRRALNRVVANKGSPGVDGMKVSELTGHLKENWPEIRERLLDGTYQPQPVKRVLIPKPGGGMRALGIPTVLDRFIQQAIMQVLQGRWDRTFSEHSYGFRPGRSAHQAVAKAQSYIAEGCRYVVDLDLEKFFDRINHDKLMGRIANRITDKRLLKLIRAFLNAGVMENGLVGPTEEGAPQGGPLSPLLSNIVLDDLDRELERRGLRFVRYADDCNIYVRSLRAGQRVMEGISDFITRKLKLKVNKDKSAVDEPSKRKFLGFTFTPGGQPKRRVAPQAVKRFKVKVRELTKRTRGMSLARMVEVLSAYLRGWVGYFGFCETKWELGHLDEWIRRRLRCAAWVQWKNARTRFDELRRRGVNRVMAAQMAGSTRGPFRLSRTKALSFALPNAYLKSLGLLSLGTK